MSTSLGRALARLPGLPLLLATAAASGCQESPGARAPAVDVSEIRIIGNNCAGVAPVMTADDGVPYAAQSVLAHYYATLELYRVQVGERPVFETDVPDDLREDVAYRTWQAKSVEILADVGETGFADRWYEGTFGVLGVGEAGPSCELVEPAAYQRRGLMAHTGLLQAGQCGENSDGDPRFWEIRPIALLWIGDVYDVDELVDAGLAGPVTSGDHGACLVWSGADGGDAGGPRCEIAYRAQAVTEAVVMDLSSGDVVAGVPVQRRAFTARGEVALPNGLDQARQVLRSDQFAAAVALGQPDFASAGIRVDEQGRVRRLVRLVGHRAGPLERPNPLLREEERQQVEGVVGRWEERCCGGDCDPDDGGGGDGGGDDGDGGDGGGDDGDGGEPGRDGGSPWPWPESDGGAPWPGLDGGSGPGQGLDAGSPPDLDAGLDAGGPLDAGADPTDAGLDAGLTPEAGPREPIPLGEGARGQRHVQVGPAASAGPGAVEDDCRTVCRAEGECESGYLTDGLVVVVTDRTIAECGGDCPHPASDPPGEEPTCRE